MSELSRCPRCEGPIPPDAPAGGLCPRCLLEQGLGSRASTHGWGGGARLPPPTPEELAPAFPQLEIRELIGQGGMGAVYKARQVRLDRLVALKILTLEAVAAPGFAERFTREARALARLAHPHIVGVHDFGESAGLYYLLMEFVDGANLREVLTSGSLSPEEALAIVPQICGALQYAHEAGVVHRDIKPENILLDSKGRVRIADFGLAKLVGHEEGGGTLTVPGQVMGTPSYMAPEQIERPATVDHRADIFSLGVVFYEMLTGELPLGRFQPPSRFVQVDVRLDEVVLRTLEKQPDRRYQKASDVSDEVSALSPARAGGPPGPGSPPPPRPPAPTPPPPRSRRSDTPVSATRAPGRRTVQVRRSRGVFWVALWSFLMALLWAAPRSVLHEGPVGLLLGRGEASGLSGLLYWSSYQLMRLLAYAAALAHVVGGVGLLRLRGWSRSLGLGLAALGCLQFPAGTALSIFPLLYLMRRDVARLFELGEGPADLEEAEARRLEALTGRRSR